MRLSTTVLLICGLCGCPAPRVITDPDPEVPAVLAAADYCETIEPFFCDYYLRCGRMAASDDAECRAQFLASCHARYEPSYVALEGAGMLTLSRDGVDACEAHLAAVPCAEQVLDLDGPCADMWQGRQPAGADCGFDVESFVCAPGTACSLGLDFCGTCEVTVAVGERCDVDGVTCATGATCEGDVCVALIPVGDPCTPDDRCVLGASCVTGTCAPPTYSAVGEPCGQGVRCPYASACITGTCVRAAPLHSACGDGTPCFSGWCDAALDGGRCAPFVAQGASCDASAQCQTGSCINGACSVMPGLCFE